MKITKSTREALQIIEQWKDKGHKIYLTSGGFDPMHIGHLRCLQGTAELADRNSEFDDTAMSRRLGGKVVVLVNGDEFLIEKKGKPFMKIDERLEIIAGVRGVDLAVEWYDGCQTVDAAIDMFRPDYFTKGGDRNDPSVLPEWDTCQKVGCEVVFGVGGGKIQSSSWLIKDSASG